MPSFLQSATARTPLLLLPLMSCLAGCLPTLTTQHVETEVVTDVCRAWTVDTYSSHDTEQSQLEARARNAARKAWGCP